MRNFLFISLLLLFQMCSNKSSQVPVSASSSIYHQNDLGLTKQGNKWVFKVYSPEAAEVKIHFYESSGGEKLQTFNLGKIEGGVWEHINGKDVTGQFYRFQVKINGKWLPETVDPYVKLVGVNGDFGFVENVSKITPEGWESHSIPMNPISKGIVYELHVRDFSISPISGMEQKGKFLAFTEKQKQTPSELSSGIDYLKELGITHLHLLPSFDYASVDEAKLGQPQYNWGYDPKNYNVPEGSYSTDPFDPKTRILEFKQAIKAIHEAGISVVMDVVYNHVYNAGDSPFEKLAPGVYFRKNKEGGFSNASGCGNETQSDHPMFRKFMVESLVYWAKEYKIDGFRFDLMAIHHIETMNLISKKLHEINPNILLYGEGWTAGGSPLPKSKQALKKNTKKLDKIAAFSDDFRDGIKGSVFDEKEPGLVNGGEGEVENVKFGIVGSISHEGIDMKKVSYSDSAWANSPLQCINYVSCHDNLTLFDKLKATLPNASERNLKKRQKLALEILLTSQGIPFLHAGSEFLRSKGGNHNSYKSPDSINQLDWTLRAQHLDLIEAIKQLINIRLAHPAFRMETAKEVQNYLVFLKSPPNTIVYELKGAAVGDEWKKIIVAINPLGKNLELPLMSANFAPVYGEVAVRPEAIKVGPFSLAIFAQK